MAFLRNRFVLQFEEVDGADRAEEERLLQLFDDKMVRYLEDRCTGFWSYSVEEDKQQDKLTIYIMFEHEGDLETFMKNSAILYRLAA